MAIRQITVQRFSIVSSKGFEDTVATMEVAIGHPEMPAFWKDVGAAHSYEDVEKLINRTVGPSGFMKFARYDHGQFLRIDRGAGAPRIVRLVIGNPLIMKKMAEHVPDAGSYAPVTVLIDERADGVHLSYDRMASYLESYGNAEALSVARDLDAKVEALLVEAAS
jgi:uncharacterized protein (DUF302 family)